MHHLKILIWIINFCWCTFGINVDSLQLRELTAFRLISPLPLPLTGWELGGNAIRLDEAVHLIHQRVSSSGWLGARRPIEYKDWVVEVQHSVKGPQIGGDFLAFVFTDIPFEQTNDTQEMKGVAVVYDSYNVRTGFLNQMSISQIYNSDILNQVFAGERIRNRMQNPIRNYVCDTRISYIDGTLQVDVPTGNNLDDPYITFLSLVIALPPTVYFTAIAKSGIALDTYLVSSVHISVLANSVSQPNGTPTSTQTIRPVAPPEPTVDSTTHTDVVPPVPTVQSTAEVAPPVTVPTPVAPQANIPQAPSEQDTSNAQQTKKETNAAILALLNDIKAEVVGLKETSVTLQADLLGLKDFANKFSSNFLTPTEQQVNQITAQLQREASSLNAVTNKLKSWNLPAEEEASSQEVASMKKLLADIQEYTSAEGGMSLVTRNMLSKLASEITQLRVNVESMSASNTHINRTYHTDADEANLWVYYVSIGLFEVLFFVAIIWFVKYKQDYNRKQHFA